MSEPRIAEAETLHLRFDLGRPRGGSGVTEVQVILVRLGDTEGTEGWGFSYVLRGPWQASVASARELGSALAGGPVPHPEQAWHLAVGSFNRTGLGAGLIGLAAIDVALWDLWAKRLRMPLGHLLGGNAVPIAVYASGGFHAGQDREDAIERADAAARAGFCGVKLRLDGRASDVHLLRCVGERLPAGVGLFGDANEKLDRGSALQLCRTGRDHGLSFLEEPFAAGDIDSLRWLSRRAEVPLATGEHIQTPQHGRVVIREQLVSIVQPDLAMIGGLTPSLRFIRAAGEFGLAASPHFLPGLHVHLASACPNLTMLEDFPLLEPLFEGWPELRDGRLQVRPDAPGHGLRPREDAVAAYRVPS